MKNIKNSVILFSIGGLGYGFLEILWRGYTHPSMLTAGGICFLFFAKIAEKLRKASTLAKALVGSLFITSVELIFGIIFNIILKKNVWDYSKLPFNLWGQICLIYSLIWSVLSIIFIPLADFVNKKLKRSV